MEKRTVEMALLLDFYGELLTGKQREYMELYYNEDFSLAEIAGLVGVTRQGVRDALQRAEAALLEFEEKTGLLQRFSEISKTAEEIEQTLRIIEIGTKTDETAPLFEKIYQALDTLS